MERRYNMSKPVNQNNKRRRDALIEHIANQIVREMIVENFLSEECLDEDMLGDMIKKTGKSTGQLLMDMFNQNKGVPITMKQILQAFQTNTATTFVRTLEKLVQSKQIQFLPKGGPGGEDAWMKKKGWFG